MGAAPDLHGGTRAAQHAEGFVGAEPHPFRPLGHHPPRSMAGSRAGQAVAPIRLHAVLQQFQRDLGPVYRRLLRRHSGGLDLFWYASKKYPHSIPISAFKDYIVYNQVDTGYYYNADARRGAARHQVGAEGPCRNSRSGRAACARHARSLRRRLSHIAAQGPELPGSQGVAPTASLDTENVERIRQGLPRARPPHSATGA